MISKTKLLKMLKIKQTMLDNTLRVFNKGTGQETFTLNEVNLFISYLKSTNSIGECVINENDFNSTEKTIEKKEDIAILSKQRKLENKQVLKNSKKLICKPHQNIAISDITQELAINNRCQYISHCGTGKTLVSQKVVEWLISELNESITLVLLPSLDLLSQFLRSWRLSTSIPSHLNPYVLCSDNEVTNGDGINNSGSYLSITKNCFTNNIEAYFLKGEIKHKLIFSTYQSAHLLSDVLEKTSTEINIGIFDEAHKTTGEFNKSFSYALYDHNIKISKRLFMTATQKINPYCLNTLTMDNELVYGRVAHRLSMREAIEQNIIRDYQIIIVTIDKDLVSHENLNDKDYKKHLVLSSLSRAIKEKNIKNGILFQKTIQESKSFVELASDFGYLSGFKIEHVDGTMKTGTRRKHINQLLSEKPTILSNAKLLSEGIDTPALDMVGFMHPSKSMVDIVQRLGRAQRKKDAGDDKKGYLFLPLFVGSDIDFSDADTEDMENWNFIIDILSVLREVDVKIKAGIEHFKQKSILPENIIDLVFNNEDSKAKYNSFVLDKLASSVKVSYYEELNTNWNNRYDELKAFIEEYGRTPKRTKEEMVLNEWCSTQRDKKRNGILSEERENLLNEISFSWNRFEDTWEKQFTKLVDFMCKNKREPVNAGTGSKVPKEEAVLAKWVGHQKGAYRNGTLKEERIAALSPYIDSWDHKGDIVWEEQFTKFKDFIKNNDCFPTDREGDERWIYRWVNKQKVAFEAGALRDEYIIRLNEVYPDWSLTGKERLWKEQCLKLESFLEEFKRVPSPNSKNKNEARVGNWFSKQKKLYFSSGLSLWQKEMIDELAEKHELQKEFVAMRVNAKEREPIRFDYTGNENWIESEKYERITSIMRYGTSNALKGCKKDGVDMTYVSKKIENKIYVNYQYILEAKSAHDKIIGYLREMDQKGIDYGKMAKELNKSFGSIHRYFNGERASKNETKDLLRFLSIPKFTMSIYKYLKKHAH